MERAVQRWIWDPTTLTYTVLSYGAVAGGSYSQKQTNEYNTTVDLWEDAVDGENDDAYPNNTGS